jgi:triosephosphate isomerase (TIM)
MVAPKPLIAGNWKMFGRRESLGEIASLWQLAGQAAGAVDMLICPPAPYIAIAAYAARETGVLIGAQDCSAIAADSARTGEVSAAMLADAGARYVILGHSERRAQHGESSALVRQKGEAALAAGLVPIICVGETLAEREAGRVEAVVGAQIGESVPSAEIVIAYEPVWAIGGDRTPTPAEIAAVHSHIRSTMVARLGRAAEGVRILYGGSVGPRNAAEIFAAEAVHGALVGRASLKAADFAAIVLAHPAVA